MRKMKLLTLLLLILAGMFTLAFNIGQVESQTPPETEWTRTYGGTDEDLANSVAQTDDGGYVLAGQTGRFPTPFDFLLVKTFANGTMQWSQTYGGANDERAYSAIQTVDGGYAITGQTTSFGAGGMDFWLVKTDASGNHQWNQTYGGTLHEIAYSVVQTPDEGYAIAGRTDSFGNPGPQNFWLIKTNSTGHMQWNQTYGGTSDDGPKSVILTDNEGYVIAGYTRSFASGSADFWLIKTFANGTMQWNQTYGVGDWDHAASVVQTSDGGYALAGETGPFVGPYDFLLVKTNSTGHMEWNKTYAHGGDEIPWSLVQTPDEGYALAGYTDAFGTGGYDFWMVKTDSSGNMLWNQTYGGTGGERAYSMVQASDGGYALAGWTWSFGAGRRDFWLIKLAPPSARALKEDALIELESALSFDPDDDDLVQAIDYLHMSLGDERGKELGSEVIWIDDWHVDEEKGVDTFQYEEEAIDKLDSYVLNDDNVETGVAAIIDSVREKLYKADKSIAEKAIEEAEAAGGVPSDVDKAKELYQDAVDTYAAGTFAYTSPKLSDVIDLFEEAWEKAVASH